MAAQARHGTACLKKVGATCESFPTKRGAWSASNKTGAPTDAPNNRQGDTLNQLRETNMGAFDWRLGAFSAGLALALATSSASFAQSKYDTGASDTEIKIGNIMPYSGPASSYSVIGKTETAYFNKINAEGGVNGRKIDFISYDDGYTPPKTVEQARKL